MLFLYTSARPPRVSALGASVSWRSPEAFASAECAQYSLELLCTVFVLK
jgi:hypothetical protein